MSLKKIFKDNSGVIISSVVIFVALMLIYSDTLDGSRSFYGANDKVSARNVKEAISKSSEYPYWFPWMMGGVPSVHSAQNISDYYPPNYIMKVLYSLGVPWFWNYIFHFLFAGIGMYFLCTRLKLDKFASTLSALGFVITPYMTGMLVHGHGSQVMTLCYMPWVFYSYINLKNNPSIKRLAVLSLFLALQLLRGHVQMAYYTWLMLGILILIDIIYQFCIKKDKNINWLLYTIASLLLGFMSSLSLYIPLLSYTPLSTRSSGEGQGAGLEYVTEFSFSFGEIVTFFIPSYYGFGGQAYWGTMAFTSFPHYMSVIMLIFAIYGAIRYKLIIFKAFLMLCLPFFLTLSFGKNFIGFYTFFYEYLPFFSKLRNPAFLLIIVQFCTMVLAGMGISMLFRDVKNRKTILPIYLITMFFLICLGFYSIDPGSGPEQAFIKKNNDPINRYKSEQLTLLEEKKQNEIIDAEIKIRELNIDNADHSIAQFKKFVSENYKSQFDELNKALAPYYKNAEQNAKDKSALVKPLITSMIDADFRTMLFLIFLTFSGIVLLYYFQPFFLKFKILNYFLLSCIGLLVFFDFHFINRRITNPENSDYLLSEDASSEYRQFYKSLNVDLSKIAMIQTKNDYTDTSYVVSRLLDKKNDGDIFRILDMDGGSSMNKWPRYHIEDVNGYHPAGLSIFQDFRDNQYIKQDSYILDMLNVKYVIGQQAISSREQSLDRAYFVRKIEIDSTDNKEKRFSELYLTNSSPADISYVTSNASNIDRNNFFITNTDTISSINNSNPNELIINLNTSGPQFLAISEVFYPKGWKASIDNKEVDIYEVNDLIRGVYIDRAGSHSVRMWFEPSDLKWGRFSTYIGFLTIFILLFFNSLRRLCSKK